VTVVAEPGNVWLFTLAQQITYEAIPDLSLDAFHARVAV
jgi:hypothetical protein